MRYLTLIALVLSATTAQADFWDNCTAYGGTIVTANSYGNDKGGLCNDPNDSTKTNNCNGKNFCLGGSAMNWWSAFTWCETVGGKLISFNDLCPGIQTNPNSSSGACPNVVGIGGEKAWGWTSTGWGTSQAFQVNLSSGGNTNRGRNGSTYFPGHQFFAICEE